MRKMNKKDDVNEDLEISQSINKKVSEAKEDTGVKKCLRKEIFLNKNDKNSKSESTENKETKKEKNKKESRLPCNKCDYVTQKIRNP